jgi:outer membrane protein assembly factor BamB
LLQRSSAEEVVWVFKAKEHGRIASSPLVVGDRVYVAAAHQTGLAAFGILYCLDREKGRELWRFDDEEGLKPVFSSPCLAGDRLYIGEGFHQDADCKLYCLDSRTGKKLWHFQTKSHVESSPCVAGGKVFFGAGAEGLYGLDAATGRELWHFEGLHIDASPAVAGNRLYAGSGAGSRHEAFCLDIDTGKPLWRTVCDLPVWGSPAIAGGLVIFGLGNGDLVNRANSPAGAVLCLRADSGQRVWRFGVPDAVLMRPAVDGERVFFGARDRHCYCIGLRDGRLRWKQDLGSAVVAAPALAGSSLYVAASSGGVSGLDTATGKIRWTFDLAEHSRTRPQIFSSPEIAGSPANRRLYVGAGLDNLADWAAVLYCLQIP